MDFSQPGNPTDNATVEFFTGRLRQEWLNENCFSQLAGQGENRSVEVVR
ncbi:integrase core domain-containing protein [Marinobacter pelagius]